MVKGRDSGMPPVELWESFFGSPADIFDALGCHTVQGDAVEFGCGYGTFTVALAPRVSGSLYALDIDPTMVSATAARADQMGMVNIKSEQRDFMCAGSGRLDGSVSLVMLFNILHIEEPLDLLCETHRILCDDGVAAVIHWKHDIATPRGPPLAIRPPPQLCQEWAERTGFRCRRLAHQLPGSPWHWGMLLQR